MRLPHPASANSGNRLLKNFGACPVFLLTVFAPADVILNNHCYVHDETGNHAIYRISDEL
jgi:hypothetical protein